MPDHFLLPNITDVTSFFHNVDILTKIDLTKRYFQVSMAPKYIPKTAITTPFGNFKFNYSCFSLRNTGAMFQTLMDSILSNLPFCMVYIDDILISALQEEHIR